jgi:hypothetical protein
MAHKSNLFANSLINELGTVKLVCFADFEEGILIIDLAAEAALLFCFKDPYSSSCSLWKLFIDDETMLQHVSSTIYMLILVTVVSMIGADGGRCGHF